MSRQRQRQRPWSVFASNKDKAISSSAVMLKFISFPQDQRYLSNIDRNRNVDHWLWNQNVLSEFALKGMWVYNNHVIMELSFFLRVMPWIYNCILSILDIDKSIMNTSNIKLKLATTDHRWPVPVKPALSLLLRRCGPWEGERQSCCWCW